MFFSTVADIYVAWKSATWATWSQMLSFIWIEDSQTIENGQMLVYLSGLGEISEALLTKWQMVCKSRHSFNSDIQTNVKYLRLHFVLLFWLSLCQFLDPPTLEVGPINWPLSVRPFVCHSVIPLVPVMILGLSSKTALRIFPIFPWV